MHLNINYQRNSNLKELLVTGAKALGNFLSGLNLSAKVAEDLKLSLSYIKKESEDVEEVLQNLSL